MALVDVQLLQTPRLQVRPVQEADLPDLMLVNGDDQVTRFLPYATWTAPEHGVSWLQRMQALDSAGTGRQSVLALRETGQVVGTVLLFKFDAGSQRAELGYVLGRAWWGRGLMHEALQALCAHVLGSAGLRRLEAEVHPANTASHALLLRLGFTHEGTARQRWVGKDGVAYDTRLYGLLAGERPAPT